MKQQRLKPDARKEDILAAALPLAVAHGYLKITREQVGRAAGVSGPVLNYHFGTMVQFRRDLMRYAVRVGSLKVVAHGLAVGDEQAKKAPEALKREALEALLGG